MQMTRLKGVSKHAELQQELVPCACGCGQLIERYYRSGGNWHERYYVRNHHKRGVPASDLQKETARAVARTPEWAQAFKRGMEQRRHNADWQKTTTAEAAKLRWTRRQRGRTRMCTCEVCGRTFERLLSAPIHARNFCSRRCSSIYHSGDNHPNYSGGERVYPPEFNNELRRKIRARDNHACQICGVTQRNLCVHHIDCDKSNNAETNLISLCRSCHMHVHGYIRRTGKIYEFTASS